MRTVAGLALLAIASLLVGCGGGPKTYSVDGTISYQGKPVTEGLINFLAPGQKPMGGPIQSDGTYRYDLPPGAYKIRVDTPPKSDWKEGQPPKPMGPRLVPDKFASYSTSGLTADVTDDEKTHHLDFKLN